MNTYYSLQGLTPDASFDGMEKSYKDDISSEEKIQKLKWKLIMIYILLQRGIIMRPST